MTARDVSIAESWAVIDRPHSVSVEFRTMQVVIGLFIAMFGAVFQSSTPGEADDILAQLSKIRLDKNQIYTVRDLTIRRDVLTLALNRGAIAFLEPINGKVTGAVFIGSGEIVAIPPDPIEKQQMYKFTGTPILNEAFQSAVFRFTDNTYEEIRKEISQHAQEDVSADDVAQFDSWTSSTGDGGTALDLRLVADFLEPAPKPLFFVELKGDKTGSFNVGFDIRAAEEVAIFQVREIGNTTVADVWGSFNQRSEARNPESTAHENKSPVDILAYEFDGTAGPENKVDAKLTIRIKPRMDGARVWNFDLSPSLRIASIFTDAAERVPFYQYAKANTVTVIFPRPLKLDQELTLRLTYAGEVIGQGPWYPSQSQQIIPSLNSNFPLPSGGSASVVEYAGHKVAPASYHDQWLVEGLRRYLAAMPIEPNDPAGTQLRTLLNDAREELKPIEDAGPIWLGSRLVSSVSPNAYPAVYGKGVWIIHMLRMILRQDGPNPDAKFLAMLKEFTEMYSGNAASTWDFKHVAEKYAEKNLDWFFDQWVFATGLPSYSVEYKVESSGNGFTIEGTITQTGVPDGFVMPVPLYADGEYLGRVQVDDSEGQFRFRLNKKPERVVMDPEMTILTATAK